MPSTLTPQSSAAESADPVHKAAALDSQGIREAAVLETAGVREADILKSAGVREAEALDAAGKRDAAILSSQGQRDINTIWEQTQRNVALSVTYGSLVIAGVLALFGRWVGTPDLQLASVVFMFGVANLVTGFYFGRTNHTRTGGVGGSAVQEDR